MEREKVTLQDSPVAPEEERERRQRKTMRIFMSFWAIGGGLILVVFFRELNINGIYAPYLGYVLMAFGVLALLGVNVFRGGPLDKRHG